MAVCLAYLTEWKSTTCHSPFINGATGPHLAPLNANRRADGFLAQVTRRKGHLHDPTTQAQTPEES